MNLLKMTRTNLYLIVTILLVSGACQQHKTLPILGRRTLSNQGDTIYHTIGQYSLINQDSMEITPAQLEGKVYVADFFFTSCPTICPTMKTQMLRVYQRFNDHEDFAIISHTIDPKHDTVAVLKEYAERIGIEDNSKWHLVTGDQSEIYRLGQSEYMVTAAADQSAPGGFMHSGAFLLVDPQRRIRGVYDGTVQEDVDKLMADIELLLQE